ncbi:MAG: VOC family protein [Chthoniobacteraceae bacterium]
MAARCAEAIEFYKKTIGAEVQMLMHYNESPEPTPPGMLAEGWETKVMHASFKIGGSLLMGSDGCSAGDGAFNGFSLSLALPTEAEAQRVFAALSEGGEVRMPLTKTFWSPCFGMLKDRFGMGWMITLPDGAQF